MRNISNNTRCDSVSQTSGDSRNFTNNFDGENHYQDIIDLANTVPLIKIFRSYNIRCNQSSCMMRCPFKSHKGGRESTGSFKYFHETNSFYCWGCTKGGQFAHGCHFVSAMEGISLDKSAYKILELFKNDIGEIADDLIIDNLDERLQITLDFSNSVREFIQLYPEALQYAEVVCEKYDKLNLSHKNLDNQALQYIVKVLKQHLNAYHNQILKG